MDGECTNCGEVGNWCSCSEEGGDGVLAVPNPHMQPGVLKESERLLHRIRTLESRLQEMQTARNCAMDERDMYWKAAIYWWREWQRTHDIVESAKSVHADYDLDRGDLPPSMLSLLDAVESTPAIQPSVPADREVTQRIERLEQIEQAAVKWRDHVLKMGLPVSLPVSQELMDTIED